jgi:imidazolonepropionase-like amidohydrolase
MGIHNRVGSLEKGKDADVVVLSGLPFDSGTRVNATIVKGEVCWQRETAKIAASNL